MNATRRFQLVNHLTLPSGLTPVDGQPNMRMEPGQTFVVDAAKCEAMQRFVRGRIAAGDMIEVTGQPDVPAAAPAPAPSSPAPAAPAPAPAFTFEPKKEG